MRIYTIGVTSRMLNRGPGPVPSVVSQVEPPTDTFGNEGFHEIWNDWLGNELWRINLWENFYARATAPEDSLAMMHSRLVAASDKV
jgi:hypothetical protein